MNRHGSFIAIFIAGLVLLLLASAARAEKRVALVIGNATYQNTQPLANPRNDADDLAGALKRVGFGVVLEHDLDKRGMERAIAQFARDARDADAWRSGLERFGPDLLVVNHTEAAALAGVDPDRPAGELAADLAARAVAESVVVTHVRGAAAARATAAPIETQPNNS